ncbi:hypothetical protein PENSPDRAFT_656490, partial [Peniophora sp. CONT]
MAPVHCLPPEILGYIFQLINLEQLDRRGHDGAPPLTYVSHVCERWRQIALDMQELWARWPRYRTADENWTLLCCLRATSAPLDLNWHIGSRYLPRVRHTLPHASRARSLDIHIYMDYTPDTCAFWHDEALPALSVPFPLLEDFSFISTEESEDYHARHLVSSLFGGICPPRLGTIFLSFCEALQSCPIYSASLQHLQVYNTRAWANVDDMIQLFQSIPKLESFEYALDSPYYNKYTFDPTPSQRYPLRAVTMDRLKSFSLRESRFVPGITIFCYLALPANASISFCCTRHEEVEEMDANELTQALEHMRLGTDALKQHFASALSQGMPYFHSIEIEAMYVRPLHHPDEEDRERLPQFICLQAPLAHTRNMLIRAEPCLMTALQPVFLRASYIRLKWLGLRRHSHRWYSLWINMHRYLRVTQLHLHGTNAVHFVDYLRIWERSAALSVPLFPLLKTIRLSDFDFTQKMSGWIMDAQDDERPFAVQFGDATNKIYGSSSFFTCIAVGTSCKGYEEAVEQLRLCLGEDRVQLDDEV